MLHVVGLKCSGMKCVCGLSINRLYRTSMEKVATEF